MNEITNIAITLPGSWTYSEYVAPQDRLARAAGSVTLILARPEAIPSDCSIRPALEIEGASHLAFCRPAVPIDSPNRSLTFDIADINGPTMLIVGNANSDGYLGKLQMNNIPSADIEKCESLALNWMQSSLTLLSFANDIPLFIWQVHISPAGTNKSWVRMPQQFFLRHHGNQQQTFPPAFAQITPAYREALNLIQISPLLSFVLFYRVIEATNALRRPPTANDARIKQRIPDTWNDICHWLSESLNLSIVTVSGAHELVPEEAVGKKFSWIIENKLRPLRNVLAHGLINEAISTITNPKGAAPVFSSLDDTSFQKLVLTWLPLCQILARLALSEVGGLETGEFGEPLSLALKRRIDQEKLNAD